MEITLLSALLLDSGENRTQDMLPVWGRLAAAWEKGMTFSLKEMQFVERSREEKSRLHFFLKKRVMQLYLISFTPSLMLIFIYLAMPHFKGFHTSLSTPCYSSQS